MLPFAGVFQWIRHDAFTITAPRICVFILVILSGAIYAPYLNNPLIFDDFNIVNGANFLDYTFRFWIAPRWLPYATLAHTYALFDGSILAMRLGNLLLHAANVVAVFVLIRELCAAALDTGKPDSICESRDLAVAALGAALLALHPVAVYGVGYLIQRTILLSTFFMLLMWIAYLRWLITDRKGLWWWSVFWYALSVLSKEHSVMAPAVALLLTFVLNRPSYAVVRRLIAPFAAYFVVAGLTVLMVKGLLGQAYEPMALDMLKDMQGLGGDRPPNTYALSIVTQSYLYFKYMFLWLVPNTGWMSVDMREPFAASMFEWPYWLGALAFLVYPIVTVGLAMRGGRVGIMGWILACPWLLFATELSAVRVQEPFVLYRAYLWFPLFGALAPLAVLRLDFRVLALLVTPVLCVLAALSWNRLDTLSDSFLMWDDAAKQLARGDEPGAGRIYFNRALALSAKGRKLEALTDMDRVAKLHPKLAPIYYTRAKIRFELKQYSKAMRDLNEAINMDSMYAAAYVARGMTLMRLGRNEDAVPDFRKSCDLKDKIGCFALDQQATANTDRPQMKGILPTKR